MFRLINPVGLFILPSFPQSCASARSRRYLVRGFGFAQFIASRSNRPPPNPAPSSLRLQKKTTRKKRRCFAPLRPFGCFLLLSSCFGFGSGRFVRSALVLSAARRWVVSFGVLFGCGFLWLLLLAFVARVFCPPNLISNEVVAFDFFNLKVEHKGATWLSQHDMISDSELVFFVNHVGKHPFSPEIPRKLFSEPISISDFVSGREFHHTGIYNEFYKLYRIDRQSCVSLSEAPDSVITCTLSRTKQDFTENEQLLLSLLAPHKCPA